MKICCCFIQSCKCELNSVDEHKITIQKNVKINYPLFSSKNTMVCSFFLFFQRTFKVFQMRKFYNSISLCLKETPYWKMSLVPRFVAHALNCWFEEKMYKSNFVLKSELLLVGSAYTKRYKLRPFMLHHLGNELKAI